MRWDIRGQSIKKTHDKSMNPLWTMKKGTQWRHKGMEGEGMGHKGKGREVALVHDTERYNEMGYGEMEHKWRIDDQKARDLAVGRRLRHVERVDGVGAT